MEPTFDWGAHAGGSLPYLAPPPRRVPPGLRARLLLGGSGIFAWIWLAATVPMTAPFLKNVDAASWIVFRGELATRPGTVVQCQPTWASEGGGKGRRGTPVYANRYRFSFRGTEYQGASYATGECLSPGSPVAVELVPDHPELSRVTGMRRALFGPAALLALLFPLAGMGMALGSALQGLRRIRLLHGGRLTLGTLVSKEPTRTRVNGRTVMRLRFSMVTDRGGPQEIVVRTSRPERLEDDARERILYDPERPERAVPWDELPGRLALDGTGNLVAPGATGTLAVLLLPLLACAGLYLAARM